MEIPADVRAALNGQVCPLPPLPYLSVPLLLSQLTDSFKIRIHHSLKHLPQVDYSVFKNHKSLNTLSVSTLLYKKKVTSSDSWPSMPHGLEETMQLL